MLQICFDIYAVLGMFTFLFSGVSLLKLSALRKRNLKNQKEQNSRMATFGKLKTKFLTLMKSY